MPFCHSGEGIMQSANGEAGGFRGDPAAGRAGFEVTKRVLFLAFLIGAMLVPLYLILGLVEERLSLSEDVASQIAQQWGGAQLIGGPVVTVPYIYRKQSVVNGAAVEESEKRFAQFLPDSLAIDAAVRTEKRYRSIYELLVYGGQIHMSGRLPAPSFEGRGVAPGDILWDQATISLGLSDMGSLRKLSFALDDKPVKPIPGLLRGHIFSSGLHAALGASVAQAGHQFAIDLTLDGSNSLEFMPLGEETSLNLTADWPSPGFIGSFLPADRQIDAKGFTAHWTISSLARGYPQSWTSDELDFSNISAGEFGVELVLPGDAYQQIDRIVKYGILVVGLTFATIFVVGLLRASRAHMVQYLLVGCSICLFYLLTLSLAEQIRFAYAYGIASLVDVGMIALYLGRTVSRSAGFITGAVLAAIHGYMYMLLQMEDYVLLAGTIGLLLALAIVMYVTRNVDWFAIGVARPVRVGQEG
jgi:inner membrane protein